MDLIRCGCSECECPYWLDGRRAEPGDICTYCYVAHRRRLAATGLTAPQTERKWPAVYVGERGHRISL